MLENLLNTGKLLNKSEQKAINGGRSVCSDYTGPVVVNCKEFYALPKQFQKCVLVSADCFPQ